MATVTYIPEKTQSKTAMGKVMRYCARKDKTVSELDGRSIQLISGKDCCAETAYREFIATKKQYGKDNGMFFYQYVQSFSPDEKITPQTAHEIGCKFAEYFKGHEVLIATHCDAAHIHTHFIINSVNFENGKKLQMARGSIHDLRRFSDEICKQYDLSIVQPKKEGLNGIRTREYRAALKGESWKFKLMNAVDSAMAHTRSKDEFIGQMRKMGYEVSWLDSRKHITYTTPDGKKCRDNKMHDDKYLKQNMEVYYECRTVEGFKQAGKPDRRISAQDTDVRHTGRNTGTAIDPVIGDSTNADTDAGENQQAADLGRDNGSAQPHMGQNSQKLRGGGREQWRIRKTRAAQPDERLEIDGSHGDNRQTDRAGGKTGGEGFIPRQVTPKVDGLGSVDFLDMLRVAKDIEALVNPYDPEKVRERQRQQALAHKKRKRQRKSHEWDLDR